VIRTKAILSRSFSVADASSWGQSLTKAKPYSRYMFPGASVYVRHLGFQVTGLKDTDNEPGQGCHALLAVGRVHDLVVAHSWRLSIDIGTPVTIAAPFLFISTTIFDKKIIDDQG
jgi:hypothetical protein